MSIIFKVNVLGYGKFSPWKLAVLDTDSARKLAAHSNGGQRSNKAMAFSAHNSVQASKFCSRISARDK